MKFQLPAPVLLPLPGGKFHEYSLADMVRHVVRNGQEFGQSADQARAGARILAAFDGATAGEVDLAPADHEALKAAIERPSCGWANLVTKAPMVVPGPGGKPVARDVERPVPVSAIDLLPLIDAVPLPLAQHHANKDPEQHG